METGPFGCEKTHTRKTEIGKRGQVKMREIDPMSTNRAASWQLYIDAPMR